MGREIRRVPPHWEHPRYTTDDALSPSMVGEYRPCHDRDFKTAALEWKEEFRQWERGAHEDARKYGCDEFWEYCPPPDKNTCRPAFVENPSWYQVYETVSEGTPVTPPFKTKDELYRHLITVGDDWAVGRGNGPIQYGIHGGDGSRQPASAMGPGKRRAQAGTGRRAPRPDRGLAPLRSARAAQPSALMQSVIRALG